MCCCMRTLLHHSMPNLAIVHIQASILAELKFYANQQSELCRLCNLWGGPISLSDEEADDDHWVFILQASGLKNLCTSPLVQCQQPWTTAVQSFLVTLLVNMRTLSNVNITLVSTHRVEVFLGDLEQSNLWPKLATNLVLLTDARSPASIWDTASHFSWTVSDFCNHSIDWFKG